MDLTALTGILVGTSLIVQDIGLNKLGSFYDIKSILIVVGGTLATTAASYPLSILTDILKHIMMLFRGRRYNAPKLVDQLVDLTMITRQDDPLALEEKAEEIRSLSFKQSILMIVDASSPDKVCLILERELENMMTCHGAAAGLYGRASACAPVFGTVGMLVGLINMLKSLNLGGSRGASSLGEGMSIALIATFYGSALSDLVFHPIAKKLHICRDEEELYCSIVIEGIVAIQSDENPKYSRKYLLASLRQSQQKKFLSRAAKNAPGGGERN